MKKTIPIEHLKPGMYLVGMDRSWFETPFWIHHRLIDDAADIARLREAGVREVMIETDRGTDVAPPPEPETTGSSAPAPDDGPSRLAHDLDIARAVWHEAMNTVQRVFDNIKTGLPADSPALRQVVSAFLAQLAERPVAVTTMAQMRQMKRLRRDLFGHAVDVCTISLIVARAHGVADSLLEPLGIGALLHDVGEMRLPQNLFEHDGTFSEKERTLVQLHPKLGLAVLRDAEGLSEETLRIVGEHHERLDGSGYPNALVGGQCSLPAQIVGLVDVYDAMASGRNGRPPLPPSQTVRRLYQLGLQKQHSTWLVERLIQVLGVYPFGSLVELNTGERGVVYAVNPEERLKPMIRLINGHDGSGATSARVLDLAAQPQDEPVRIITRILDPDKEQTDVTRYCEV